MGGASSLLDPPVNVEPELDDVSPVLAAVVALAAPL